jgi:hydroxyacylglutathione hydrolase
MDVRCFTVGLFQANAFLVTDEATGAAAIVDTGEGDELARRLSELDPAPDIKMILLTHGHIDHAGGLYDLQKVWDVPTYMCGAERPIFDTMPMQGSMFGMAALNKPCGRIDHEVEDGAEVMLGETKLRFLATPGHTPGQGCWYDDSDVLVGDTLFAGSIGRTDFPLSNPAAMKDSLRRLMALPGELRVHSGHGPVTTLGKELASNPFLGFVRSERGIEGARSPGFDW